MTKTERPKKNVSKQLVQKPDPKKYAGFVAGLQLKSLQLEQCEAKLLGMPKPTRQRQTGEVEIKFSSEIVEAGASDFVLRMTTTVDAKRAEKLVLSIKLCHLTSYSASIAPTDVMLDLFKSTSLPMHVWPYCREIVADLTQKMDVPPIVLPLLTQPGVDQKKSDSKPKAKPRRKRAES